MTNTDNLQQRYNAYLALSLFLETTQENKEKILPDFKRGINDPALDLRSLNARILLYYGQPEGIPILIAGLDPKYSDITMPSEPPKSLTNYSAASLIQYTDQDFGLDQSKWQVWWQQNQATIKWDEKQKKFITK